MVPHAVAEHQRADQRHAGRKHQTGNDGADDGEQDLFALADGTKLAHHDATVLLRREHPNERRLDQRDEACFKINLILFLIIAAPPAFLIF